MRLVFCRWFGLTGAVLLVTSGCLFEYGELDFREEPSNSDSRDTPDVTSEPSPSMSDTTAEQPTAAGPASGGAPTEPGATNGASGEPQVSTLSLTLATDAGALVSGDGAGGFEGSDR